ncbi:MAG: HAD family hydrolase [Gammaproteobacteria bacterium]|uniref:histidinol-phosphatase n=1 Tax=Pseudomaricurvus alcaniphilus TaxID=1166482 RepID=UPI00140DCF17|nr:HAD family hydrolase [Gammaproteobacteria bacterium]NHN37121.1 HAD family hydrolase [Pseudomaricurvus alcaniphilus]
MKLAIFDLDNTLIAGDSDHGWGEFMVAEGMVDPVTYKRANDQFYADYERGNMDLEAYLNFSLQPLTRYQPQELARLHSKFMREVIAPLRLPAADRLLQQHRDQGDYLLIITSTNDFITAPIAAELGVDYLLATNAAQQGGRYTGKIVGVPCFQAGKVTRLQQWLTEASEHGFDGDLTGASFYSDSINDLPLLQVVDNPVAVDPDAALRQYAEQHHWPIISLRD